MADETKSKTVPPPLTLKSPTPPLVSRLVPGAVRATARPQSAVRASSFPPAGRASAPLPPQRNQLPARSPVVRDNASSGASATGGGASRLSAAARTVLQQNTVNQVEADGRVIWPDLSSYGLWLGTVKMPSGQSRLVLVDESGKWAGVAENQGFTATKFSGVYVREVTRLNLAELRLLFPRMKSLRLTPDEITKIISAKMVERRSLGAGAPIPAPPIPAVPTTPQAAPPTQTVATSEQVAEPAPDQAAPVVEPARPDASLSPVAHPDASYGRGVRAVDESLSATPSGAPLAEESRSEAQDDARSTLTEAEIVGELPLGAALRQSVFLGVNHLGDEVFEGVDGRFIRRVNSDPEANALTEANFTPAVHLRAKSDEDLMLCARGLVREIQTGRILRSDDLTRFLAATFPEKASDVTETPGVSASDALARFASAPDDVKREHITRVNRAIDAVYFQVLSEAEAVPSIEEAMAQTASAADQSLGANLGAAPAISSTGEANREAAVAHVDAARFALALTLHEGQPSRFQRSGEYTTPAPLGVVMQRLLCLPPDGTRVRAQVTESVPGEHSALIEGRIERAVDGEPFSHFVGGMFGKPLDEPVEFNNIRFRFEDQLQIAQMLDKRGPKGRAVIALAIDSPGSLDPRFRRFADWLFSRYKVEGVFDVDPSLVGQSAKLGTRVLVVGERNAEPAIVQLPSSVPVCLDYQAVWAEGEKVRASIISSSPAPLNLEDHIQLVNPFQAPYIPGSQVSEPGMMIPRNLATPTRMAIRALEQRHKMSIDDFVCKHLAWTKEELIEKEYLNAEQVDAVALAIDAWKRGRAITLGDTTGAGKGRQLAALIRFLRLQGERPVFVTKTADLFQDIYRDLEDIGSLDLVKNPLIMNRDEVVVSRDGQWTATSQPKDVAEAVFRSGKLPRRYDLVLMTYSQVNRKAFLGDLSMTREKAEKEYEAQVKLVGLNAAAMPDYPDSYSLRSGWAVQVCKGRAVIFDEGHEAAGPGSNVGSNARLMAANAELVAFSSATFLKDKKNLSFFKRMFPENVGVDMLRDTMRSGGVAIQEALCAQFAQDGVLIRREHDLSMARIETLHLDAFAARNREAADQLAEVLASLAYLTREIGGRVGALTKAEETRLQAAYTNLSDNRKSKAALRTGRVEMAAFNFGSRIFGISRQFMLCLKAEGVAEHAVTSLKEGRKPVIAFDMTMEGPLRKIIQSFAPRGGVTIDGSAEPAVELFDAEADDAAQISAQADALEGIAPEEVLPDAPTTSAAIPWSTGPAGEKTYSLPQRLTFRDVLKVAVASVFKVKVTRTSFLETVEQAKARGEVLSQDEIDAAFDNEVSIEEVIDVSDPALLEAYRALEEQIDKLPDLPASPVDVIRDAIQKAGFTVGEISGRTISVTDEKTIDGRVVSVVRPLERLSKQETKASFNNGKFDAVLLSKAGGVGSSLHASARFLDRRQRELIEAQAPSDVADRLQMFGRVNRLDQVVPPYIRQVSSGLPGENRLFMIQNMALRKLSANTTSNRDHAALANHLPDLLNVVGNEVCFRFLENNPDVAKRLLIDVTESALDDQDVSNTHFANLLTSRLILLPCKLQEEAYDLLAEEFQAHVTELDQAGANPLRPKEFDLRATLLESTVLQEYADIDDDSVFNEPLLLQQIEYEETTLAHDVKEVKRSLSEAKERAGLNSVVFQNLVGMGMKLSDLKRGTVTATQACAHGVNKVRRAVLETAIAQGFETVEQALAAPKHNITKEASQRMDKLVEMLSAVDFGKKVTFSSTMHSEEPLEGYIVRIEFPIDPKRIHYSNDYRLTLLVPGYWGYFHRCLTVLRGDPAFAVAAESNEQQMAKELMGVKSGVMTHRRFVLTGNIFRAAEHSAMHKLGSLGTFTDKQGARHRGVVLPLKATAKSIGNLPLLDAQVAFEAFKTTGEVNSTPTGAALTNVSLKRHDDGSVRVFFPGTKDFAQLFRTEGAPFLPFLTNQDGNRRARWATVPEESVQPLLEAFFKRGMKMYADRIHAPALRAPLAASRARWAKLREEAREAKRLAREQAKSDANSDAQAPLELDDQNQKTASATTTAIHDCVIDAASAEPEKLEHEEGDAPAGSAPQGLHRIPMASFALR